MVRALVLPVENRVAASACFCTTNSPARKSSTLTEPVFPLTFMKSELNRFTAGRIRMNYGGRIQSHDRRTFRDTERPAKLDNRDPLLLAGEFVHKPAAFDEQESPAQLLQFVELMAGDEHGDAAVAIPPKPHKFKHRADWEVRAAGRTITV